MEKDKGHYYDLIMALFVTVIILSNIASSAKIIDWGISVFGINLAFDAGTLLFPLGYVICDILTEVYGYRRSRRVIWMGFACLVLSSFVLYLVRILPGETSWEGYAGQKAFDAVFLGVTSGGIVLASLAGYFAGEFSNAFVLAKMKIMTKGRWLWTRTIGSTLVGQGLDTVLFILIATWLGVFPPELMVSLILTNYLFKVAVEVLMTPVTYLVAGHIKKKEGIDFYDYETKFNPFRREGPAGRFGSGRES